MRRDLIALLSPIAFVGCIDATNPCDPDAELSERKTSTLRGLVEDQDGAPMAGVTVTIPGHPTPAISGDDGGFSFEQLPPNEDGYELIALPDAPAIGGRTVAPPLGCKDDVGGVTLIVAVPPASPEVEIVQATSPDRLFVAFSAASGSTHYRVEVRAPFETWQPAVLSSEPVDAALLASGGDYERDSATDDDARSFCGAFRYVHADLESENARCAEVVGIVHDGDVLPLEEHGSYEVRVRAERTLDDGLVVSQRLPEMVESQATGVPGELSLVPTALLPVMLDPDPAAHLQKLGAMQVDAIVPVADGRFAMLGALGNSAGMMIVGQAAHTAPDAYDNVDTAPTNAMAYDEDSATATAEVTANEGRGVALLPAGRWVRVWKRFTDPETLTARSQVEKVFIGNTDLSEQHIPQAEPEFAFDTTALGAGGQVRAFSWLVRPEHRLPGDDHYNPPDGYMLLMRSGYVLLEREGVGEALLDVFAEDFEDGSADHVYGGSGSNEPNAMTTGICSQLGSGALGVDGPDGQRSIRVCLDLEGALGEVLNLTGAAILPRRMDAVHPADTFHVLTDTAGDRVLAVESESLLGRDGRPLKDLISEVRVGVQPAAMTSARLLDCGSAPAPAVLVANRGSLDISVLSVVGTGFTARVEETAIIGVPGVPVRFLEDPDGVTCHDPFVWVVLDDGRMVPLDMRRDRLGVPTCGGEACAVRSRDRAPVGAVSRDVDGRSRVLVGGRGMLGEVGFLRPSSAEASH